MKQKEFTHPAGQKPKSGKSYGKRPHYGDKKPYLKEGTAEDGKGAPSESGKKPYRKKSFQDAPHGNKPYGAKPYFGKGKSEKKSRAASDFGKKSSAAKAPRKTHEGIFSSTRHGYGFIDREGQDSIFIPAAYTMGALSGDTVNYTINDSRGGRAEGRVTEIVSYAKETLIGILVSERIEGRGHKNHAVTRFLIPDDSRYPELQLEFCPYNDGDKIEAVIERHRNSEPTGRAIRNFGSGESQGANYAAILAGNRIDTVFPDDVLADAAASSGETLSPDGRDIPEDLIFTIDGADAKDLDDAVSVRKLSECRWLLGVHIADVSHYVRRGSATEENAFHRGTSVYFTDKVVPMLPEVLSNGACSLNAGEDKYALSAYMTMDKSGAILETVVKRSLIRSCVRGVYTEVNDIFDKGQKSAFYEKYKEVATILADMKELYGVLRKKSKKRGAIDFDRPEGVILLDKSGEPTDIVCRTRGVAERMIEQFMLAANEGVATLMRAKNLPLVYRVHEDPDREKTDTFVTFAEALGLDVSAVRHTEGKEPIAFANLLRSAEKRGIGSAVSGVMLRTMAKAKYDDKPHRHFGLAIDDYCHFTSPIRRLSDLVTHRAVKALLLDGENAGSYMSYVHKAAEAATEGELRAVAAERAIDDLYKAVYMAKHIGEEYDAEIVGVTSFGIFAALENTCEGLIPFGEQEERYVFDESRMTVMGESAVYRMGDKIRIKVIDADIAASRVRFEFVKNASSEE